MDNHGIYIGNIKSRLNNRGGNQHVDLAGNEFIHDLFQLMLLHLSVGEGYVCLRHQFRYLRRNLRDIVDTIVDIVNLAAPSQLSADGRPNHLTVVLHHVGLNRQTVLGRLLQHAHIPDSNQAHMERPGNRRSCQRQHIDIFLQLLDFLLVSHAEALLLVDDQKSQILELHV